MFKLYHRSSIFAPCGVPNNTHGERLINPRPCRRRNTARQSLTDNRAANIIPSAESAVEDNSIAVAALRECISKTVRSTRATGV